MLTLILAAAALAAEPAPATAKEMLPAGQNATTVFQKTTLTKVGEVKAGAVTYEMKCATVNGTKTCSAYDKGKVVSTSTSVSTTPNNGFTATFPDTFTPKSVTYEVKK